MWCGGDYMNCWRGDDYNNADAGRVKVKPGCGIAMHLPGTVCLEMDSQQGVPLLLQYSRLILFYWVLFFPVNHMMILSLYSSKCRTCKLSLTDVTKMGKVFFLLLKSKLHHLNEHIIHQKEEKKIRGPDS